MYRFSLTEGKEIESACHGGDNQHNAMSNGRYVNSLSKEPQKNQLHNVTGRALRLVLVKSSCTAVRTRENFAGQSNRAMNIA